MSLTIYPANFEQLAPASDRASSAAFRLARRQTDGSHVVAESHRALEAKKSHVVDETVVYVLRMKGHLIQREELLVGAGKTSSSGRSDSGDPVVVLSAVKKINWLIKKFVVQKMNIW